MNPKPIERIEIEPERYEFRLFPTHHVGLDRREFVKVLGGGVAVFFLLRDAAAFQESGRTRRGFEESLPQNIGAWLHIGEKGQVTVFTGKVEVGQNIRTSLTQAVAEELRVPIDSIKLVMGDTDLTPFDMGTFGSRTTPTMSLELRRVASAARGLLLEFAARNWKADPTKLIAAEGKISDPCGKRNVAYSELARGQALAQTIIGNDPLTPAAKWTVAGKSIPKINGEGFVTGEHRYTPDLKLEGMLYGKILRPADFGATLASLNTSNAEAIPGVTVVHDGNFVGVAAPSLPEADRALAAIRSEWKSIPQPSTRGLFEYLKSHTERGDRASFETGSVKNALASAEHRHVATYTVAYIAHAPLEPRAAVAEWSDGRLTVWTGTQRPFAVRNELAEAFRIPEDRVHVLVPDTGGAYGGKHTGDAAVEAARLARAAGKPVKLVWTRQEEFTWAYFRPAGVIEINSGVSRAGILAAWEFHNYNSGAAAIRTPYEVPNQLIEFHPVESPLRQGSYRALAATANHFARESHMDELAHGVKIDPLQFRLMNLKDERLRAVISAAAKAFRWGRAKTEIGQGFGIAGGVEKGGFVATCAEVLVDRSSGSVRVARVVTAFDCGAIVNPDGLKNQIEGAIIMGLGGALFEAIEFEDGRILTDRFSKYRVPRFGDVPSIEVVVLDRKDQPSAGAGETPIVAVAPAIGNAIFDATGLRFRSLPMAPNKAKV